MTLQDVHDYFWRNWQLAMRELGFSQNAYQAWLRKGYIPLATQGKIQIKTKNKLKADVLHTPDGVFDDDE